MTTGDLKKKTNENEAKRLGELFLESFRALMSRSRGDHLAIMHHSGLTLPQIFALHILEKAPASITELAAKLTLSAAATSHLVERLFRAGYVERAEDENDRRHKKVSIAKKGAELIKRLDSARAREAAKGFSALSPCLRRELVDVLTKMRGELDAALDDKEAK